MCPVTARRAPARPCWPPRGRCARRRPARARRSAQPRRPRRRRAPQPRRRRRPRPGCCRCWAAPRARRGPPPRPACRPPAGARRTHKYHNPNPGLLPGQLPCSGSCMSVHDSRIWPAAASERHQPCSHCTRCLAWPRACGWRAAPASHAQAGAALAAACAPAAPHTHACLPRPRGGAHVGQDHEARAVSGGGPSLRCGADQAADQRRALQRARGHHRRHACAACPW